MALKEWAVVVEAMARGRQTLLLRKGGIADPDETFQLEHREFFLFPTLEHQKRDQVRAEFHPLFDEVVKRSSQPGQIQLPLYAGVAGHWPVQLAEDLAGLERFHIWTPEFLAMRLAYKPEIPTLAVVVRAYTLSKPPVIPNVPAYAGCRSWVPLEQAAPVEGAIPVMENQVFRLALEQIAEHFHAQSR